MLFTFAWAALAAVFSLSIAMVVWGRNGDGSIDYKSEYNFAMNQKSLHPGNEMLARGGKWESIVFYCFLANKKISKFFKCASIPRLTR